MMRILIAEDEQPLLRGIKIMIERIDPNFVVVCTAKNGKEAIDYLSQHEVDIVFTDINMPLIGGLQVLEFLAEKLPDVQSVVISGYSEFEYACSAMRFGASNYLLKPVDIDELAKLLGTMKEALVKQSYNQKREELLARMFGSGAPDSGCAFGKLRMAYLCVGAYQHSETLQEMSRPGFWFDDAIVAKMRAFVKSQGDLWFFWGQYPNEGVLVTEDAVADFCPQVKELLQQHLYGEFLTITGVRELTDADELPRSMHMLRSHLRHNLVFGRSTLIPLESSRRPFALSEETKTNICYLAQKRKADEFTLMLHQMKTEFAIQPITQHDLEIAVEEILSLLQQEFSFTDWRSAHQSAQDIVSQSPDYDYLFQQLMILCGDMFKNKAFNTDGKENLMRAVDEYIRQNLSNPLSTQELSTRFGLVAPYLSRLFKDYKGLSPAQYIQSLRIERAKSMLMQTPVMLAKDIAAALGYANPLYFSKTFKKNVGVYPSEYRKMHQKST